MSKTHESVAADQSLAWTRYRQLEDRYVGYAVVIGRHRGSAALRQRTDDPLLESALRHDACGHPSRHVRPGTLTNTHRSPSSSSWTAVMAGGGGCVGVPIPVAPVFSNHAGSRVREASRRPSDVHRVR